MRKVDMEPKPDVPSVPRAVMESQWRNEPTHDQVRALRAVGQYHEPPQHVHYYQPPKVKKNITYKKMNVTPDVLARINKAQAQRANALQNRFKNLGGNEEDYIYDNEELDEESV
jgi:hypothetical protein